MHLYHFVSSSNLGEPEECSKTQTIPVDVAPPTMPPVQPSLLNTAPAALSWFSRGVIP